MEIPGFVWIAGGLSFLLVVGVLVFFLTRARQVNLTRPMSPDEKPVWMRTTPPPETIAATRADGEGITLYDHDEGEQVAAPFAEQIEDILQAHIQRDPALASFKVDFGTTPDGELAIWVNDTCYTDVNEVPNEQLREAIRQAITKWQQL